MQFDIITIFPNIFDSYLKESFIKKAQEKGLVKINIHNLRDWATDKHKTVDDRPFGGGLGMVLKVEPLYQAISTLAKFKITGRAQKSEARDENKVLNEHKNLKIILFTPRGRKFNQQLAYKFSKLSRLIFICGRYEGVDERAAKHIADIELSIGDYDLMGGELPAMVVMETISRLMPGVLGKPELLKQRISKDKGFLEYPQYTRPEIFSPEKDIKWKVPKVLLSGNHKKIEEWRKKKAKEIGKS